MTNAFLRSMFRLTYCDETIASEFEAPPFTDRMLDFERGWSKALRDVGTASPGDADIALRAIETLDELDWSSGTQADGVPVLALVKALRRVCHKVRHRRYIAAQRVMT